MSVAIRLETTVIPSTLGLIKSKLHSRISQRQVVINQFLLLIDCVVAV